MPFILILSAQGQPIIDTRTGQAAMRWVSKHSRAAARQSARSAMRKARHARFLADGHNEHFIPAKYLHADERRRFPFGKVERIRHIWNPEWGQGRQCLRDVRAVASKAEAEALRAHA